MPSRTKEVSSTIAAKIRELRVRNGLTQKELGDKLFKAESTIRMWELGKSEPDLSTIAALSNVFGVTTDFIIKNEKQKGICEMTKLKELLYEQRLSEISLAELLNIPVAEVMQIINGEKEADNLMLCKIADILSVRLDELFGRIVIPKQARMKNRLKATRRYIGGSEQYMASKLNISIGLYTSLENNDMQLKLEDSRAICEAFPDLNLDPYWIMGAKYRITRDIDEWDESEREDFDNATPLLQEALRFIFGRGVCYDEKVMVVTNEEEIKILEMYRELSADAKHNIKQNLEKKTIEEKRANAQLKNQRNVG